MSDVGEKSSDFLLIKQTVDLYFKGIYQGDIEKLKRCFHANAVLRGLVNGADYSKNLDDYLHVVENRQSPESLGEVFNMKILSVDIDGDIAVAKLSCPIFQFNYVDYLTMVKQNGEWLIYSKVFINK